MLPPFNSPGKGMEADGPNQIGRQVGMEARQIVKAIRVAPSGQLSDEQRQKIRDLVKNHMRLYRLNQREASLAIDRPTSTISEVLSAKYDGDSDPILRALNQWVEDDEIRRNASRPMGFYSTCVFETILALAKWAKSNARVPTRKNEAQQMDASRIALGYGPSGCGKSAGADALHADDPRSVLVRVISGSESANGFSRLIVRALGASPHPYRRKNMDIILARLKDSGRLLIIDEAHRLELSACELIRDIADVCGVPILMLGTQEVSERLTKARVGSGVLNYDQFASRVGMQFDLIRGIDGNGGVERPIFSLDEITALYRAQELKLSKDAQDFLQAVACTIGQGMLRLASNVWQLVVRGLRNKSQTLVTIDHVREATKYTLFSKGLDVPEIIGRIEQTFQHNRELRAVAG